MKTSYRRHQAGFSLMELMVVVALIVALAGLTVGGMAMAQQNSARKKAEVQVKLLETALQDYYTDNKSFPSSEDATGESGSRVLYKALYKDGYDAGTKIYLPQLDPDQNKEGKGSGQGWIKASNNADAEIVDPWGKVYRYRTGGSARNPDFDLWSAGKDGKTSSETNSADTKDDIRNFK